MNIDQKPIYPVEPWCITETEFSQDNNYRNETTFALSNGYIGTRGTFEEGYDFDLEHGLEGNFINGFYESEEIRYGEWNYGFPQTSQSMLNICNGKKILIYLDDELFDMRKGRLLSYRRTLHMDEGLLRRELLWETETGKQLSLSTERLVSFAEKNCMAVRMLIKPLQFDGVVRVESVLDADVMNHTRKTNPLVDYGPFGRRLLPEHIKVWEQGASYEGNTKQSGLSLACRVWHECSIRPDKAECVQEEYRGINRYEWKSLPKEGLVLEKIIAYTTSLDMEKEAMHGFLEQLEQRLGGGAYEDMRTKQLAYMKEFWRRADVKMAGDDMLQQGIRFNLFHIMQAAGRDGRTGMGAKGLSGEGYEGHYFWDTEMYMLPVFVYTCPEVARQLLEYRYHTLDKARERARVLGHEKGALYPWRTINGEEASTYFPLGTAQYHINADIAYAFWLYITVTGDMDYLERAAEVLCESARVFADVGCFAECRDGRYCICAVTGPDEYNAIVDNNFYTNLMARENLRDALAALKLLKEKRPEACDSLVKRLGLTEEEASLWQKIIDNMYLPYDEKRGVYPLDDGFLMRKPWDDSKIPPEKRHLLYENYHPLFIYRQRMSKQADAILGMYLHSDLFTREELERNYDFYQEVTLHHSSLSTCIFGIVACQIGRYEEAYRYFSQSARMDLDDYHQNFYAGIHGANMAGTWLALINGFAGLRAAGGCLRFQPYLPKDWQGYSFPIGWRGCLLQVEIRRGEAVFTLEEGDTLEFYVGDKKISLREGGSCIEKI